MAQLAIVSREQLDQPRHELDTIKAPVRATFADYKKNNEKQDIKGNKIFFTNLAQLAIFSNGFQTKFKIKFFFRILRIGQLFGQSAEYVKHFLL